MSFFQTAENWWKIYYYCQSSRSLKVKIWTDSERRVVCDSWVYCLLSNASDAKCYEANL